MIAKLFDSEELEWVARHEDMKQYWWYGNEDDNEDGKSLVKKEMLLENKDEHKCSSVIFQLCLLLFLADCALHNAPLCYHPLNSPLHLILVWIHLLVHLTCLTNNHLCSFSNWQIVKGRLQAWSSLNSFAKGIILTAIPDNVLESKNTIDSCLTSNDNSW